MFGGGASQGQPPGLAFGQPLAGQTQGFGARTQPAAQSMPLLTAAAPSTGALARLPSSFAAHPFQYITECFDAQSPNYRFRFFFYNALPAGPAGAAPQAPARPPLVSDRMWRQALEDNPDPARYVPVAACGFGDLLARRDWQDALEAAQRTKLDELGGRIGALLGRQDLDVTAALQAAQRQQLRLTRRLLAVLGRLQGLARAPGAALGPREAAIYSRLQVLRARLAAAPLAPAEVTALAAQCAALAEAGRLDPHAAARAMPPPTPDALAAVARQQRALALLVDAVSRDTRDLDVIRHGYA